MLSSMFFFLAKECAQVLVNYLEDENCSEENVWLR